MNKEKLIAQCVNALGNVVGVGRQRTQGAESSVGLRQRTGKLTGEQALQATKGSVPLMALWHKDRKLANRMHRLLVDPEGSDFYSAASVRGLGQPLVRMRQFESTPGLWLLDDVETGILFVIWSDGYKKNPWKGTSYEAVIPEGADGKLVAAFDRLVDFIKNSRSSATT